MYSYFQLLGWENVDVLLFFFFKLGQMTQFYSEVGKFISTETVFFLFIQCHDEFTFLRNFKN